MPFANSSRRRSAKRPWGIPSWVVSAMKRGIGRGFGRTPAPYLRLEAVTQVRGSALGRVDVDVDAGPELEAGLDRQAGGDVDVPVELVSPAGGSADPEVELGRAVEEVGEGAQGGADHRRAALVLLEAGSLPARDHPQLERGARGPGADQRRLLVDCDQAVAAAHLLDEDVAEQPTAGGAFAVGADALALAGDGGRDERERVELGVGVLERGTGATALVDDQLQVGGIGMGPLPLPPGGDGDGELLLAKPGHRSHVLGRVDQDLVRPLSRP